MFEVIGEHKTDLIKYLPCESFIVKNYMCLSKRTKIVKSTSNSLFLSFTNYFISKYKYCTEVKHQLTKCY